MDKDDETQRVINNNRFKISKLCKEVLDGIVISLHTMPFGIRWIAKQFVLQAQKHFSQINNREKHLLIGGFIFLRYITPAIISPDLYGVTDEKLTFNQRRTLVLIAKVLQNLANDHFFEGKRVIYATNEYISCKYKGFITKIL